MTVSSPVCVCVCVCVCARVCVYLQSGCVVGHGAAHPLVAAVLLDVCDPVLTLRHHLPPLQVEVLVDHLRRTHGGTTLWSHTEITHKGCRTQQRCALSINALCPRSHVNARGATRHMVNGLHTRRVLIRALACALRWVAASAKHLNVNIHRAFLTRRVSSPARPLRCVHLTPWDTVCNTLGSFRSGQASISEPDIEALNRKK